MKKIIDYIKIKLLLLKTKKTYAEMLEDSNDKLSKMLQRLIAENAVLKHKISMYRDVANMQDKRIMRIGS